MGFISRMLAETRNETYAEKFLSASDLDSTLSTSSGIEVSESIAISLTAVYACVRLISWTIASLPCVLYKHQGRSREKAVANPIYSLVHDAPNTEQTSFEWRAVTAVHQLLWGAGISEIEFNSSGKPIALWPIPPWLVTPKKDKKIGVWYEIYTPDTGEKRTLLPYQILVFPMLSASSYSWASPITMHRETIGAAIAVRQYGAKTFGQGTNPAGVIYHPGRLDEDGAKTLSSSLKNYAGLGGASRLMLLDQAMKWERVGLPPEDAQYLETRRFDISEIARIYSVPLYMLQDHEKQTSWGSGIEEQNIGYVTFTLMPYLVQWEQQFNKKLLLNSAEFFVKFNVNGLLRGKYLERTQGQILRRQWGIDSANDIREREDENPLPGDQGETYLNPMNMINAIFSKEYNPLTKDKNNE